MTKENNNNKAITHGDTENTQTSQVSFTIFHDDLMPDGCRPGTIKALLPPTRAWFMSKAPAVIHAK